MKKWTALLLCLTFLVTGCMLASAEELGENQLAELKNFGIFQGDENGNLCLENTITRAEFCKVILAALGFSEKDLEGGGVAFSDVDNSHWAKTHVLAAARMGLIKGQGDGTFLPDENTSVADVMKMTVVALGYGEQAEALGGYPTGYITVAKNLGLNQGSINDFDAPALRGEVAQIVYTALDKPIMQQTGFGAESTYQVMDGTNGTKLITLRTMLQDK